MARGLPTKTTYVSTDEHMPLVMRQCLYGLPMCTNLQIICRAVSCLLQALSCCDLSSRFLNLRLLMEVVSSRCLQCLQISFQTLCSICMLVHMVAFLATSQGRPSPSRSPSIPCSRLLSRHSPQPQHSADPVIDPTRAGRAPSGPIGASLESRRLIQQQPGRPGTSLLPSLQGVRPYHL